MSVLTVGFALAMPLLLGAAPATVLLRRPAADWQWPEWCGVAWLLGAPILGLSLALFARVPPAAVFTAAVPWLVPIGLVAWAVAWRFTPAATAPARAQVRPWQRAVWWSMALLLAAHWLLAAWQAWALPTLPWDAWTTWIGKARLWYGAPEFAAWLAPDAWLAGEGGRATLAPHYPDTLPRLAVWVASANGRWDAAVVHLWWPTLWLALAALCHGGLRRLTDVPWIAMAGTWALLSLPLVDAHLALAGYADLWVAALATLAALALMRWRRESDWRMAALAGLAAAALPAIKLEGAVWMLCIFAAAGWALLPPRGRLWVPVAVAVAFGVVLALGGLSIPAPGLGMVRVRWGEIELPGILTLALHWRPVVAEVAVAMLVLPTWHLLWWAVPVVALLRWRTFANDPALHVAAALLVLGCGFVFVLFFLTDAAAWAENFTSINRILLHVAGPAVAAITVALAAPAHARTPG